MRLLTAVRVTLTLLVAGAPAGGRVLSGAARPACGVSRAAGRSSATAYIIGGVEADVLEFPWLVSLQLAVSDRYDDDCKAYLGDDEDVEHGDEELPGCETCSSEPIGDYENNLENEHDGHDEDEYYDNDHDDDDDDDYIVGDEHKDSNNGCDNDVNNGSDIVSAGTIVDENGIRWEHYCGASIIDERWLLTSAHCVDPLDENTILRVAFGAHNLSAPNEIGAFSQTFSVKGRLFTHENYSNEDDGYTDYDFALIRLPRPLDFDGVHSHVAKICLPTTEDLDSFTDSVCVTGGWGDTQPDGAAKNRPRVLQKLPVGVATFDTCLRLWNLEEWDSEVANLTRRHLCAVNPDSLKSTIWSGDSGGTLQCERDGRWLLAGVPSLVRFTRDYALNLHLHARVAEILPWLGQMGVPLETENKT